MSEPLYRNEYWLREQYRDKSRSSVDIADQCDVTASTICKWLNRHGIETRSSRDQVENYYDKEEWKASISETKTEGKSQKLQDPKWLREKYVEEGLSSYEIAELVGVTRPTVCNWLHRHDLDVADPGTPNAGDVDQLKDADWLRDQYKHQEKSVLDIADDLDVDHKTVRRYLNKHEIEIDSISIGHLRKSGAKLELLRDSDWIREQYNTEKLSISEIAEKCCVTPSTLSDWMDDHGIEKAGPSGCRGNPEKLRNKKWLREKYIDEHLSIIEISELLDITAPTVLRWLDRHDIETRDKHPTGEDHPLWKDGNERFRGSSWDHIRKEALRRDQYRCQRCGVIQPDHLENTGRSLHVHHIIPYNDFEDRSEANQLDNLISLCESCHMTVERNDEVTV